MYEKYEKSKENPDERAASLQKYLKEKLSKDLSDRSLQKYIHKYNSIIKFNFIIEIL